MYRVFAVCVCVLLSACASSHLVTGTPRAPIDPAQVRIYQVTPSTPYEEIAQLTAHSGAFAYGEQNKVNAVMHKLRREAAKLGANGVLFVDSYDEAGGSTVSVGGGTGRIGGRGFSSGGIGVSISPRQKHAVGIAIYVPDPPSLLSRPHDTRYSRRFACLKFTLSECGNMRDSAFTCKNVIKYLIFAVEPLTRAT